MDHSDLRSIEHVIAEKLLTNQISAQDATRLLNAISRVDEMSDRIPMEDK